MLIKTFFDFLFQAKHTTKWQVVFWLNAGLLLYLTLMPSVQYHIPYHNIDKLFHFIGFGAFAFFCTLAFPRLAIFWTMFVSFLLGVGVEVVQSFLPHRAFSYADMIADFAGIVAAVSFLWVAKKIALRLNPPVIIL